MCITCSKCTLVNYVIQDDLKLRQYCNMCNHIIYVPDNEMIQSIFEANDKKDKIRDNLEKCIQFIPNSLIPSKMIYINGVIRNKKQTYNVQFLVDTGAQFSVIPYDIVKALELDDYVEHSYNGMLEGVGKDKIMGKIHYLEIELSCGIVPISVVICKKNTLHPILGIDMMQHLGLSIDFKKRHIMIDAKVIPFT